MVGALLYHGGFHSLQLQRVAHAAWDAGHKTSALRIQVSSCRSPPANISKPLFGSLHVHVGGDAAADQLPQSPE